MDLLNKIMEKYQDYFVGGKKRMKRQVEEFNSIIDFANGVVESFNQMEKYKFDEKEVKEHPLIDVIRVLGKKLQTEYLTYLLSTIRESQKADIKPWEVMLDSLKFITPEGDCLYSVINEIESKKRIYLRKDVVLPWAWNRGRLINCFASIGEGRKTGEWEQDDNHSTELWLPMGITWVHSGNHSISVGIIQGEGVISPSKVYDISPLFDILYCDGAYYRFKSDNSIFHEVKNVEFAAMFEIGRIMAQNNISF